ncbi:ACP phosphodiesterase [Photobacterium sagamiensis]
MADFVRGDPYKQHPKHVADGIKLHRFVDSYVDGMPEVKACRQRFSPGTRRVSGIALDIVWDHFLASHWQQYHSQSLECFVQAAEHTVSQYQSNLPEHYQHMSSLMWRQQWLLQYRERSSIGHVLQRMAIRRPKLYQLALCSPQIDTHYRYLEQTFHLIYPQLIAAAKQQRKRQR